MIYYLSLGSNIGDREFALEQGIEQLSRLGRIEKKSKIYESDALGGITYERFLNAACRLDTVCSPYRLLRKIKQIELRFGRQRRIRWAEREVDIDIIDREGAEINSSILNIPHQALTQRLFVLLPLKDVAPEYRNQQAVHIDELIKSCPDQSSVVVLKTKW